MNVTKLNCSKAKQINLFDYINKQGLKPIKMKQFEAWYHSPFREEKTASFKINLNKNIWYDFGEGIGGNIIDFVSRINNCDVKEALSIIDQNTFSFEKPKIIESPTPILKNKILKVAQLTNLNLLNYLNDRKINLSIAKEICCQIHYSFNEGKEYYGIGFKNDFGGFEIRSKYFKGCLGKKNITTIDNNSSVASLFESWSDFLSYLTLKKEDPLEDYFILNSTSLIKKLEGKLDKYNQVKVFFDNDHSGEKAWLFLIEKYPNSNIIDNRIYYKNYNDLNEFLIKR